MNYKELLPTCVFTAILLCIFLYIGDSIIYTMSDVNVNVTDFDNVGTPIPIVPIIPVLIIVIGIIIISIGYVGGFDDNEKKE